MSTRVRPQPQPNVFKGMRTHGLHAIRMDGPTHKEVRFDHNQVLCPSDKCSPKTCLETLLYSGQLEECNWPGVSPLATHA
jgi:hypothetical protein